MKKLSAIILLIVSLSGCEFFSKLTAIEYNNRIVENLNEASLALEETANLYNETIPSIVTEESEIDVSTLKTSLESSKVLLAEIKNLSSLQSKNPDQETQVEESLISYSEAAENYFVSYEEMLLYYESGEFIKDVSKVTPIDESIHLNYSTFIDANNDLVELLDSFMEE